MKAFRFKKVSEKSKHMFRTFRETFDKHFTLGIGEQDSFNCIEISNSKSSNCIYEITDLKIRLNSNSTLSLLIGDSLQGTEFNSKKLSYHFFTYLIDDVLSEQNTELTSIEATALQYNDLLKDYSILLLPGGSLFIRSEETINIDDLFLKWSSEDI